MTTKIKIGIVGATGYTGVELLRLLSSHPNAEVTAVTSRSEAGIAVGDYFPSLRSIYDLTFQTPEEAGLDRCDLVFFATPNGVAMKEAPALVEKGVRVIDLSADFRIRDIPTWEQWYKMTHAAPQLVSQAVYGLCELYKDDISKAMLVANPGCYPTCVSLPLLPLLQAGRLKANAPLIADCKSGVPVQAAKPAPTPYCAKQATTSKPMASAATAICLKSDKPCPGLQDHVSDGLIFVPHLVPMIRGMHATLYLHLQEHTDPEALLREYYRDSPFVDVLPSGSTPETRSVRGANLCRISVKEHPIKTMCGLFFPSSTTWLKAQRSSRAEYEHHVRPARNHRPD